MGDGGAIGMRPGGEGREVSVPARGAPRALAQARRQAPCALLGTATGQAGRRMAYHGMCRTRCCCDVDGDGRGRVRGDAGSGTRGSALHAPAQGNPRARARCSPARMLVRCGGAQCCVEQAWIVRISLGVASISIIPQSGMSTQLFCIRCAHSLPIRERRLLRGCQKRIATP